MNETDVQALHDLETALQRMKDHREARVKRLAQLSHEIAVLDDEIAQRQAARQRCQQERDRLLGMDREWFYDGADTPVPMRFGI